MRPKSLEFPKEHYTGRSKNIQSMIKLFNIGQILLGWLLVLTLQGCYSFKGINTGQLQTFRVDYFENQAQLIFPVLSQSLTEGLKTRITSESNLRLAGEEADAVFKGVINNYTITPVGAV